MIAPPAIHLCPRCHRGPLTYFGITPDSLSQPGPGREMGWCYVCGFRGVTPLVYVPVTPGLSDDPR